MDILIGISIGLNIAIGSFFGVKYLTNRKKIAIIQKMNEDQLAREREMAEHFDKMMDFSVEKAYRRAK